MVLVQFGILILTPLGAVVGGRGYVTLVLLLAVKAPRARNTTEVWALHVYNPNINIIINIITAASFIINVIIHKGNENLVELNETREQKIRRLENQQ